MPEKKPRAAIDAAPPPSTEPARYRILAGGVSGAEGRAYYHGQVVEATQLGDAARVEALLGRRSIEEVADAAD